MLRFAPQVALRRPTACVRGRRRPAAGDESGQALVEAAIVMPLMVFLILGVIQLVMMQHARIMTEYAAFNAARAGIVWNADQAIMENAATISLMPTYDRLVEEHDIGNPAQMLRRIIQRAVIYQVNRRLAQAIGLLRSGTGSLIDKIAIHDKVDEPIQDGLEGIRDVVLDAVESGGDYWLQEQVADAVDGDERLVEVELLSPRFSAGSVIEDAISGGIDTAIDWTIDKVLPGTPATPELDDVASEAQKSLEDTFDKAPRGPKNDFDDFANRNATRLTIRVQYLYPMRVPFANWVIHQAWLAGRAGRRIYGAIWNPQSAPSTGLGRGPGAGDNAFDDPLLQKLDKLARAGVFMVPLTATYTMRMQSNPYRQALKLW